MEDYQPAGPTETLGCTVIPSLIASISRVLGLLAETKADRDKASEHLDDALAFCLRGYSPELAWTCHDYADCPLQRINLVSQESWACGH